MHDIEPYYQWRHLYCAEEDEQSPFYGRTYSEFTFTDTIYGYYIHPQWDHIGSDTLYIKLLYADYDGGGAIIECMGEWNDAITNDIMHLKRNVIDELLIAGISKFVLIGENVFNFHGSDDCYYEEWFEEVDEGFIIALGFSDVVLHEWKNYGIDRYVDFGGQLELDNWRTFLPDKLLLVLETIFRRRIGWA